jgi:hypothetical protein
MIKMPPLINHIIVTVLMLNGILIRFKSFFMPFVPSKKSTIAKGDIIKTINNEIMLTTNKNVFRKFIAEYTPFEQPFL